MPKVWNKRDPRVPKDAIYVGRPSPWGNPWVIGTHGDREWCIQKYKEWFPTSGLDASKLRGKDLVCWCKPRNCHADFLLEVANAD